MEHTGSTQRYAWEIDFSGYADEWFEVEDRDQYEKAIGFVTTPEGVLRFIPDDIDIRLTDLTYNRKHRRDSMRSSFTSSKGLTEDELVEARELFLEALEESYIPHMTATYEGAEVLKQGITYEADPERGDLPITMSTDPEWEGPIMQRAMNDKFFRYDSPEQVEEL